MGGGVKFVESTCKCKGIRGWWFKTSAEKHFPCLLRRFWAKVVKFSSPASATIMIFVDFCLICLQTMKK